METLESLGDRIATTKDLQSIVRTMKSLSAVSIRQYERATESLRSYNQTIELGLQVVMHRQNVREWPGEDMRGPTIAVVFGSDHGLCGRFNEQIVRFARQQLRGVEAQGARILWLAVGLRAAARLEADDQEIGEELWLPGAVEGLTATAHTVLLKLDEWRDRHGATHVAVFHNVRNEDTTASPRMIELLPLNLRWLRDLRRRPWRSRRLPTFTMDPDELFSSLIREHLFVAIYRAGAESMASEHATRLAAMQAAERNIEEHLEEMNAEYRRRRQESITAELLDVVAGFESLQSTP